MDERISLKICYNCDVSMLKKEIHKIEHTVKMANCIIFMMILMLSWVLTTIFLFELINYFI